MYVTTSRLVGGNSFQRTQSWRTGRLLPGEHPREVVTNPPVSTGRLGSDLSKRLGYYKTLAANLQSQPKYQGHVLTSDGGHAFQTALLTSRPGSLRLIDRATQKVVRVGEVVPRLYMSRRDKEFLWTGPNSDRSLLQLSAIPYESAAITAQDDVLSQQVSASITNMLPDHGEMGWFETLVELSRGNFPKLIPDLAKRIRKGRKLDPRGLGRDLGSDYLNARFGIEPIVRDTLALIENLQSVSDLLYNNIKRVRKTYPIDSRQLSTIGMVRFPNEPNNEFGYTTRVGEYSTFCTSDVIVKAKFSKVLPRGRDLQYLDEAAGYLRKLGFNEKLAWDLIPFSWLVDWSGRIGSSIENAAAFAPETGRYLSSYMWATRKTTYAASFSARTQSDSWSTTETGPSWISCVVKQRYPVSPFGVNFTLGSLSAYQWSILSALGLANLR